MARLSDLSKDRLFLVALGLFAVLPPFLHFRILAASIDQVRIMGGLHPTEILFLRWAGQLTVVPPLVILGAFVLSMAGSSSRRSLIALPALFFAAVTVLYVWSAIIVIFLHVAH